MSARPPIIDADGHILDREQDVRRYLQPLWEHPGLPAATKQKILYDNARVLFGLGAPAATPA